MDYWYSDIDIHLLLNHQVQQDTLVCQAITQDIQQATKLFDDVIKIFNENQSIKKALIPINLGNNNEGVFIGSHWTALVLINNQENNICALFADPLGQPIEISTPIINQLFQMLQITLIFNSSIKQQTNNYDCGPLTVYNLFCLAKVGKLPNNIDDTFIFQQRTLLCKLKETQLTDEEKQIMSIPDNYTFKQEFDFLDCLPKSQSISQLTDTLITTSHLSTNNNQGNSNSDNYNTSEEFIFYSLPKSNLIPELTDSLITNGENNNCFPSSKAINSNITYKSEMHEKILKARESYIQSNDKFKVKSSLSLEDDTLDILQSIPHNKTVEEITNTNLDSQIRLEEIKRKDIKKLLEMVNVIDLCITNKIQLSMAFIKLGDISGGSDKISYNDTDGNCIRNKYGHIRRDKNGIINHNGIYFEKLYQIKLILEDSNENDQTNLVLDALEKISENLKRDLKNIKLIIISILNDKKEFLPKDHTLIIHEITEPINPIMENIINFANIHYYPMILNRIKQEISKVEIFNMNNRENRYYLARILTIIGELSREYIEDNSSINNDDIREMFKQFRTMRNLFVHCHDKIITGIADNAQRDCINNNIVYILNGLNECIENGTLKTDYDYKGINENIQNFKRIFTKSKIKNIQNSNQESSELPQQLPQQIPQQTKSFSDDLYSHNSQPKINENVKRNNDRKSLNKSKTEMIKLINQSQKILSKNPANISELLEALDQKYQILIKALSEDSSDQYPLKLNETNSIIIDNFVKNLQQAKKSQTNIPTKSKENQVEQSLKSDKLVAKIKELVDETEYLIIFEKLKFQKDSDRSYVIEHIVSAIGQIMRDITDLNLCLNALQTSHIHDSASKSAVSSRNQGLAHDIFAFDKNWFDKQILDNILPAYEHFQAILTISKKYDNETSRITLFSIAFSFLKLGLYDNAVDYFKRTIQYIAKHPHRIENKTPDRIHIFQALFHINVNTSFEELMGIDIYTFTSRIYLMQTYIIACKYDESYKELEILKKNMQIHRIMEMKDESISCFVYDVYNGMVHCLLNQGKNKASIDLLNEIIPISNYHFFKVHLAWAYHFENIPDKAYEIITNILPSILDPINKYIALYRYVRILSYQTNKKKSIIEANKAIKDMEKLFEDNYTLFKKKYDDEFLIMKSHLIRLKVQLLVDKCWLPDNNEKQYKQMTDKLEEYIIQFHDISKFIKHDLQYDVRISSMYFWICRAYSALISDKVSDIELEKKKVEKAQYYFDKANVRLDYFKQTGRISVSSIKEMIKTADYLAYGYNKLASRNDLEDELKNIYMSNAAPYMAMIKRYFQQYQSSNVYTPLFAQVKSSNLDTNMFDCEQNIIEKTIVDKFIASDIKINVKDVNISINIKKTQKDKVMNYCCSVLKLEQSDIEFDNNTCWISLGYKNIEILRKKADEHQKKK